MNRMNERERELLAIQQTEFMTDDLRLFLNTHPNCEEALCALKYYLDVERDLKGKYEKCYGPLSLEGIEEQDCYNWIHGVWPWEMGE